ncbi:MAG TPA: carboxypeptidase-like regulatory domain-containing protein [Gemmatimonadaceae bacterium]|nr:carboxypeptidase-like regulatory domain-containing protein [Gemmatimonadaceae bacterium]
MRARIIPTLLAVLTAGAATHAQRPARMTGRVTDKSTGAGLVRAELILVSDSRSAVTDSMGRYAFENLPAGVAHFMVRAPQFPMVTLYVDLTEGQDLERPVQMDSTAEGRGVQELAPLAVSAAAPVVNYRMVDFERRRVNGHGQYRNEQELVKSGAYTLQDVVIPMRGVNVDCSKTTPSGDGCRIHMFRAPTNCDPQFVVDGSVDNWFGPRTPIRDIIGLEVYSGPSDVPGEFAGSNSMCGVIVIWTRSGPTKQSKPSKSRNPGADAHR